MSAGGDDAGSITHRIGGLKGGDPEVMDRLWARDFERLAALARKRLQASRRASLGADEDIALSALNSLWVRASGGRLPELSGRDELWRLLVVITARKAASRVIHGGRQERGGGRVVGEEVLGRLGDSSASADALAQFAGSEPSPDFVAMVAEETARRLADLPDPTLRQVAVLRMEGPTNHEIARELGCVVRTVERKLDVLRRLWGAESGA